MLLVHDEWLLTPYRAAVHRPTGVAVLADLHLGYARARCRGGEAVPAPEDAHLTEDLRSLAEVGRARHLVVAGDAAEAGMNPAVAAELREAVRQGGLELLAVVPGNHDRFQEGQTFGLPVCSEGFAVGGWRVVHGDGPPAAGKCVYGHFHPCLRWGGSSAPCYLVGPETLVLPAFSRDAAGVNVRHDTRWAAFRCCAIVGEKVLDFGRLDTLPERLRTQRVRDVRARDARITSAVSPEVRSTNADDSPPTPSGRRPQDRPHAPGRP